MRNIFWYLATPYSKYPYGIEEAFRLAVLQRGLLLKEGIPVFSPIIHSHPVALMCAIDPFDHSIWLPAEEPILKCASGLIMVMAEGWESSYGMTKECEAFGAAGKPIIYMTPGMIPLELKQHIDEISPF